MTGGINEQSTVCYCSHTWRPHLKSTNTSQEMFFFCDGAWVHLRARTCVCVCACVRVCVCLRAYVRTCVGANTVLLCIMCGSLVFWYEIVLELHFDNCPNVIILTLFYFAYPVWCLLKRVFIFLCFQMIIFALTHLLSLPLIGNPFSISFFANFFHEVIPVGRGSSFRRAVDKVGLVRSLLPGVPLIVVIVMAATASPTTQTRGEDQLKMTARVIASPFLSEIRV